jgi:hypothetical protein
VAKASCVLVSQHGAITHSVASATTTGAMIMKAQKPATTPKSKSAKDLKPKKDPAGGIGLLLPAVQKVTGSDARGG